MCIEEVENMYYGNGSRSHEARLLKWNMRESEQALQCLHRNFVGTYNTESPYARG